MSMIKILDPFTANQIAAGEVVERPVSVVKELVENAIDAGASRVSLTLLEGGLKRIQVLDNGGGMTAADLVMAPRRHATSKIVCADDLNHLHTLGFRGEALPSIAAVSRMTIRSRTAEIPNGWQVAMTMGEPGQPEEVGCAVGTMVTVDELFFNTPARKKFLKSPSTELALITEMIGRMAMSRPEVAFELTEGGRSLIKSPGNGDAAQAVFAVYGGEIARQMTPIALAGEIAIHGLASRPELTRSSRHYYNFFINGRLVHSSELSAVMDAAYYTRIPGKRFPLAVVHFNLPPDSFDVNVHPAKMAVKFHRPQIVQEAFAQCLEQVFLRSSRSIPGMTVPNPAAQLRPAPEPDDEKQISERSPQLQDEPQLNEPRIQVQDGPQIDQRRAETQIDEPGSPQRDEPLIQAEIAEPDQAIPAPVPVDQTVAFQVRSPGQPYLREDHSRQEKISFFSASASPAAAPVQPEAAPLFSAFRVIGQMEGSYILAEGPEGLYLIDQHAAHERIRYEKISRIFADQPAAYEFLAVPQTLELTAQQAIWLVDHILALGELGFILEHFGENTFLLRGVPRWNQGGNSAELLLTIVDKLGSETGPFDLKQWAEEEIFSMACKSAVKANRFLTSGDIGFLMQRLEETANPYSCPHGRPVMIKLTREEIKRRFLRT